jgi:hypothetical protein
VRLMAGNLTYLGQYTVGGCIPASGALYAAIVAELQARLTAALALQAGLTLTPPTLVAQIEIVGQLLVALKAALELGLPGVDFQVSACAELIADLEARIALLLGFPLGVAGVEAYIYDGDAGSFGPAVAGTVGTGLPNGRASDHVNALVLATSIPATWAALGEVFLQ